MEGTLKPGFIRARLGSARAGLVATHLFLVLLLWLLAWAPLAAQTRPLRTSDAEILPPGTLRAEVGFDFLQDVDFPLSGLSGDVTSVGVIGLRLGVGKIVEVQLEGAVQNFLDIRNRGKSFVPLQLAVASSAHDAGDFSLSTKIRILPETDHRPSFAMRFGFKMPNSKQNNGIGTNSTDVFAAMILQKHFGKLNVFGDVGLAILQATNTQFKQNDVLLFGGAFSYPLHRRVNVVGEVAGRRSTRKISTDLIGTESQSQARLGLQIFAGGFQWDLAGLAGIAKNDPRSGFTFGVSKDFRLFDYGKLQ